MAAVAVVTGAVVVVVLAGGKGNSSAPSEPPPFVPVLQANPTIAYDVQRREGDHLTVTSGTPPDVRTTDITLASGLRIDVLEPVALSEIRPGDAVTAVGITNAVKNLSIRSFVFVSQAGAPAPTGPARSAGGFAGHEGARDQAERPVLWGRVTAANGGNLSLETPNGPATAEIGPEAVLQRLRPGQTADIHDGDRIVVFTGPGGDADFARGILVRAGGAK